MEWHLLIQRAKAGDAQARIEIFHDYNVQLMHRLHRQGCSTAEVLFEVERIFSLAWLRFEEYDPSQNFLAWLCTLRNTP